MSVSGPPSFLQGDQGTRAREGCGGREETMTGETGELRCTLLSCIFISIYSYRLRMVSMELRILLTSIYEREIGFVASYPNVTEW